MGYRNLAILSILALLSLSACTETRVYPSGLTLSKADRNMQDWGEELLEPQTNSANTSPSVRPSESNALHLSNY